jgi:RHS repeat-associated protein
MPGLLPPQSGYTYAVDLSADEALSAGAKSLRFNQPVFHYVENFLNFPVGGIVPVGYYDRDKAAWIPSNNGRVIKILNAPPGGLAEVDTDGDDLADNGQGITDAERQQLASLYTAGQSLWRVPIPHFSPWDCNWPYGLPDGASGPGGGPPGGGGGGGGAGGAGGGGGGDNGKCKDQCCEEGSVIGCHNQTLGEAVRIAGTRFSLHYESDRVPGYKAVYTLRIPLSGSSVPQNLLRIKIEVLVAGRIFQESFPPAANQTYTFTWDGQDAYGRTLQGDQPVRINIGYVYPAVYRTPAENNQAFAQFGGEAIIADRYRNEITLRQEWPRLIGTWDTAGQGLGGWTLNVHHAYVPLKQTLYRGDGGRRTATGVNNLVVKTIAGDGTWGSSGDGGPATEAWIYAPKGIAVGPDGSLYITDETSRIRRVGPDGIITTVAGTGVSGFRGDGDLATQARLYQPQGVAIGPDGSLYIADTSNSRIRRVGPDGIITTVAGTGVQGFAGDGGPATQAQLYFPIGVAIGPDGSFYIADTSNERIRRVGPDGIITTVAGTGVRGIPSDDNEGIPATQVNLNRPGGVAVGPDGSFYITDLSSRSRRVGPDGIITTAAGNGNFGFGGDGGLATSAQIAHPFSVAVGRDGSLYIADSGNQRIRWVVPDGIITTIAGKGLGGVGGEGGPATAASIASPRGIAVGPDGSLYFASNDNRVKQVRSAQPDLVVSDIIIPSEDGSVLYILDGQSRHLRTLDALTGAVRYEFSYDDAGRLAAVTDGDGNRTTIERDGAGIPTTILAPFGQRTVLALDANGFLFRITNPAGEAVEFSYTADGLLSSMTDPRGNLYNYTYDDLGRLIQDEDPAGGSKVLSQTNQGQDYTVTLGAGLGGSTTYRVESLATGGQRRVNTLPNGLQSEWVSRPDGTHTTLSPDGTQINQTFGPDPRWGMLAPVRQTLTQTTPGALSANTQITRTATLTDPNDLFSLSGLSETRSINGRTYTHSFAAAGKVFTTSTPAGRQISTTVNDRRRPVRMQIANLLPSEFGYDSRGRLTTVTTGDGPDIRSVSLTYNPNGYLETITDPLGRTVSYQYDAAGRITQRTLPDGRIIQAAYDANGNITAITPPGRPTHGFSYTAVNLLSEYTPPDVLAGTDQTQYAYNVNRKLTRITRPDGESVYFGYDSAGRPSTTTLSRGQVGYAFNGTSGRLETITAPGGINLSYSHDGALLTGETWTGAIASSITRTYDNNHRLTSTRLNGVDTISFEYDVDGLLTRTGDLTLTRDAQNGLLTGTTIGTITDTRGYNRFGEGISYGATHNGTPLFVQAFARDKLRRISRITETVEGETNTYDYTYDLAGRLTEVRVAGDTVATYTYDSNGNRLTGPSGTTTYTYDAQDRLITSTSGLETRNFGYAGNGELQTRTVGGQTTTYTYDALGNLMAVTLSDGAQIDYLVDGRNRRIGKKVNGALVQSFLYQGKLKPVAELDGAGNLVSRFVYATRKNVPEYMVRDGFTYRIITDPLGSPRLVINVASGEIVQRMDYSEFGAITRDTNPGFQPFGFAGGLYDRHTGLVRFGARDYDAETGRWTAKDLILFSGRDTNLYGYVRNDPINRRDPTGLQQEFLDEWREGGIAALDALAPDADDGLAANILSPLWMFPCGIAIGAYGVAIPTLLEDLTHWIPPMGLFGVPIPENSEEQTPTPADGPQCSPDDSTSPDDQECDDNGFGFHIEVPPGFYPEL